MAFQFKLAAVLRVRESIERREESALQRVQLEMAIVLSQIEKLKARITCAHDTREQALERSITACDLHLMISDAQAAEAKKNTLLAELQALTLRRNQQLQVYHAAHRAHEMLTGMRDKQHEAYDREVALRLQKYLDDIFIARRQRG